MDNVWKQRKLDAIKIYSKTGQKRLRNLCAMFVVYFDQKPFGRFGRTPFRSKG